MKIHSVQTDSALYKVITGIQRDFFPEEEWRIFSYRSPKDFAMLWSSEIAECLQHGNVTFLIVWEGIPAASRDHEVIDISRYLTPVDWAATFAIRYGNQHSFRVIIYDAFSSQTAGAPGLEFYRSAPGMFPWLRFVTAQHSLFEAVNSTPYLDDAFKRDVVAQYWTAVLGKPVNPEDAGAHHALANIVGPLILLGSKIGDSRERAMQQMMRWIGMISDDEEGEPNCGAWIDWTDESFRKRLERIGHPLRLLLLDDCAFNHHWAEVLSAALGAELVTSVRRKSSAASLQLHASDTPEPCLRSMGILEDSPLTNLDKRFSMTFDGNRLDMLFLDLRLFQGATLAAEAELYKKLLPVARHFLVRRKGDMRTVDGAELPWPGIWKQDFKKVVLWIQGNLPADQKLDGQAFEYLFRPGTLRAAPQPRETDSYLQAMTLLPRLLALLDFSLPIVLFSSTARRDIVKNLEPYGNIITDFEKPHPTVAPTIQAVTLARRQLNQAIKKALDLLVARGKCRILCDLARNNSFNPTTPNKAGGKGYLELFLGESGTKDESDFTIGGCFALFDDLDSANGFEDDLVAGGVRYCRFGAAPWLGEPQVKNNKTACAHEVTKVCKASQHTPVHLGVVRIKSQSLPGSQRNDLLSPRGIDNRFRFALRALLEIFLCESLPALEARFGKTIEVSVFAATRTPTVGTSVYQKQVHYRFGIRPHGDSEASYTFGNDDVYPIISEVFATHGQSHRVDRAFAVTLHYDNFTPRDDAKIQFVCRICRTIVEPDPNHACPRCGYPAYPDYRALHYVADEVLGNFPTAGKENKYDRVFHSQEYQSLTWLLPENAGEFDEVYSENIKEPLRCSLEASRCADRGDLAGAVVLMNMENLIPRVPLAKPLARHWIAARIGERLLSATSTTSGLSGTDFLEVAERLTRNVS